MFLSNEQVTEEIKEQIKKFLETNDNENITTQMHTVKAVLRQKSIAIPQEIRKTANRQPNFTPETTGKRTTKKKLVERKKS